MYGMCWVHKGHLTLNSSKMLSEPTPQYERAQCWFAGAASSVGIRWLLASSIAVWEVLKIAPFAFPGFFSGVACYCCHHLPHARLRIASLPIVLQRRFVVLRRDSVTRGFRYPHSFVICCWWWCCCWWSQTSFEEESGLHPQPRCTHYELVYALLYNPLYPLRSTMIMGSYWIEASGLRWMCWASCKCVRRVDSDCKRSWRTTAMRKQNTGVF